jgi:hypothetical protein
MNWVSPGGPCFANRRGTLFLDIVDSIFNAVAGVAQRE